MASDTISATQPPSASPLLVSGLLLPFLFTTTYVHRRHTRALSSGKALSLKRLLYTFISYLAPALAAINFLAVLAPVLALVMEAVEHTVIAVVMTGFMELLYLLIFRLELHAEHLQRSGSTSGNGSPEDPRALHHFFPPALTHERLSYLLEEGGYVAGVARRLSSGAPIKLYASPPLCCCLAGCACLPCGTAQHPSARVLDSMRLAVRLYVAGAMVGPLFELWIDGSLFEPYHRWHATHPP